KGSSGGSCWFWSNCGVLPAPGHFVLAKLQASSAVTLRRKKASGNSASNDISRPTMDENATEAINRLRLASAKPATSDETAGAFSNLSCADGVGGLTLTISFQISSSWKCPRCESPTGSRKLNNRTRACVSIPHHGQLRDSL